MKRLFFHSLFIWLLSFFCLAADLFDPSAVYLTWQQHPESTMTILWLTSAERKDDVIEYQKVGQELWQKTKGEHKPLPGNCGKMLLHCVELLGLEPASLYRFRPGSDGVEFKFRTMPTQLDQPIRFVVGGDIYHDQLSIVEETNRRAAKTDPSFAVLGGDISYAADRFSILPEDCQRWLEWLSAWKKTMVTTEGCLIPILPVIGNHDVRGRYGQTPAQAQIFYALFPMPGSKGYNVLDFGCYLSLFLLDSGHTHSINGDQASWLQRVLQFRQHVSNKFAIYHVPAYPAVRNYNEKISTEIRKEWVPYFEDFGVNAVFEHHDHVYKRTVPIFHNQLDPQGIVYFGDGAWGVQKPRIPQTPEQLWYLNKSASKRHFIMVTLDGHKRSFQAIDDKGEVFDELIQKIDFIPSRE